MNRTAPGVTALPRDLFPGAPELSTTLQQGQSPIAHPKLSIDAGRCEPTHRQGLELLIEATWYRIVGRAAQCGPS